MSTLLLMVASLTATHHAKPTLATWEACSTTTGCHWYRMPKARRRPTGHWHACTYSPAATICVTYPTWRRASQHLARRNAPYRTESSYSTSRGTTELMLVTYYLATGSPMANGIMPSIGWAACGYDLPLGAHVSVPGVGNLTCGDRIGFQPWRHIDVFNVPLATGYRYVTVYP